MSCARVTNSCPRLTNSCPRLTKSYARLTTVSRSHDLRTRSHEIDTSISTKQHVYLRHRKADLSLVKLNCAHDLLSRAQEIVSRGNELISRAHEFVTCHDKIFYLHVPLGAMYLAEESQIGMTITKNINFSTFMYQISLLLS